MRRLCTLALVSIVAAIAVPASVQALTLPPASPPGIEMLRHAANGKPRLRKTYRHRNGYAFRRHRDDICSIVNGWRAFPLRGAHGYFDTGRVPCCRC
jgi:hypothetical protein